jgi:hypothetical protein
VLCKARFKERDEGSFKFLSPHGERLGEGWVYISNANEDETAFAKPQKKLNS